MAGHMYARGIRVGFRHVEALSVVEAPSLPWNTERHKTYNRLVKYILQEKNILVGLQKRGDIPPQFLVGSVQITKVAV